MSAASRLLAVALAVYPLLWLLLFDEVGLVGPVLVFGALLAARLCLLTGLSTSTRIFAGVGVLVAAAAVAVGQDPRIFKLYPVIVNGALLAFGLYTLVRPPSAIERLMARLDVPVSAAGVGYTRGVTMLWCGYFALNGGLAAYTALAAPDWVWAIHNGVLSYAVAGALFAGEWLFRGWYKRRVATAPGLSARL